MDIVLLAAEGASTNIVFNAIERDYRLRGVVIEERVPRRQFLLRRARRLGYRVVAGQILFQSIVPPLLGKLSQRRITEIIGTCGLDTSPIPRSRVTRVPSANSAQTRALLQHLSPDVVVINGTRIITAETLSAVSADFVNIHAGITPFYRGVHGGYWALASADPANFGVTVHQVDSGLDTGPILHQARIATARRDNFATYPLLQLGAAVPLLLQHLASPDRGIIAEGISESRAWSHPTLGSYLTTALRTGVW
ncbi:MAG: formyl transferase [Solirubrobacteraceae bacterium]